MIRTHQEHRISRRAPSSIATDTFQTNRCTWCNRRMHLRGSPRLSLGRCTSRLIYGALTSPTTTTRCSAHRRRRTLARARARTRRFVLRLRESRVIAGSVLGRRRPRRRLHFASSRRVNCPIDLRRRRKRAGVITRTIAACAGPQL